jgi:hypothetical protein
MSELGTDERQGRPGDQARGSPGAGGQVPSLDRVKQAFGSAHDVSAEAGTAADSNPGAHAGGPGL